MMGNTTGETMVIVDYGAGNLTSVRLAFERLGRTALVTNEPSAIRDAERVVFPGVGAVRSAMTRLRTMGLDGAIWEAVARGTPFLGICLGTQIVFGRSEEDGGTECLGILPGDVKAFPRGMPGVKVPQIGWNRVAFTVPHPLFEGIEDGTEFYFVHGYYPCPSDPAQVIAQTEYAGQMFASVTGRGNLAATQFHPERSGKAGLMMLDNFIRWDGRSGTVC